VQPMGVVVVADSQYAVGRAAGMCCMEHKVEDASCWLAVDNTGERS